MPSPIGHALAGFAAGWTISPQQAPLPLDRAPRDGESAAAAAFRNVRRWRWPLLFALVGMLADLDLLVGLHSRYTHSLGVAIAVFLVTLVLVRGRGARGAALLALAFGCAYASHVLLDWLADDTSPPIGIMALWPFSDRFYNSSLRLFMGISRQYWVPSVWWHDSLSVLRELLILVPVACSVWLFRRRPTRS